MNEADSLEPDNIEVKEGLHRHESSNDWDDLGIDFENASQTVSTNESSNTPKPRSNLDEVIDLVVLDALEYADASPEKRVLPNLVRKSTKSRSKQAVNINCNSGSTNSANFSTVSNHQMTTNNHTTNALMTQSVVSNNTNNNSLHPLMQTNFVHPNMQQMAAQLQLAATGKGIVAGSNTSTSLMQHNANNQTQQQQQQQQQQLTAAMMGFGSQQLPNMMMPTYNGNVPITYHQQMASGQYHLPVTFAQIQQLQQQYQQQQQQQTQQQQQQTQQHQQPQQSHLLLSSNPNSSDMTAVNSAQQTNMNFVAGSNTNPQQQQTMLPASYTNFPNQSIPVTPYQIPGMMHTFASPGGPASNTGTQLMASNSPSSIANGIVPSATNARYLSNSSGNSNATSANNSNNCTNTSITASHNGPNSTALSSSSVNSIGASTVTAASMASLYQQLPPNAINASPFDFHQQQLLYNQRLLQAQQAQQAASTNSAGILSDYTVPRYTGY